VCIRMRDQRASGLDLAHNRLVTLGHCHIISYKEFTERLMDRFDRRDLNIHFRDLAQLRQTGTAEAFITEFQQVAVAVTNISRPKLIMLFTEGLKEPLRGWVKEYRPHTLQDAILCTRDLAYSASKTTLFQSLRTTKGPRQKAIPERVEGQGEVG
jgi:hypothetical protein